eukprot:6180569-Pleurochrysis_carterae.AAC.5
MFMSGKMPLVNICNSADEPLVFQGSMTGARRQNRRGGCEVRVTGVQRSVLTSWRSSYLEAAMHFDKLQPRWRLDCYPRLLLEV